MNLMRVEEKRRAEDVSKICAQMPGTRVVAEQVTEYERPDSRGFAFICLCAWFSNVSLLPGTVLGT